VVHPDLYSQPEKMILLIDSSGETGTVGLSQNGELLFSEENKIAREHAAWLHSAIGRVLAEAGKTVRDLEAVAVVAGPGSYTGLRVGMAAAKGFCYALKIPLITQNTLRVMAESMKAVAAEKDALICPMIDARRDEVFVALYKSLTESMTDDRLPLSESMTDDRLPLTEDTFSPGTGEQVRPTVNGQRSSDHPSPQPNQTVNHQRSTVNELNEILPPQAKILDKTAFELELARNSIVFFGSGAAKWQKMISSSAAIFEPQPNTIQSFAALAQVDFTRQNWADPVYAEPVYLKEFFSY
jgi:tRNA threonylcarbamoyladenosine biosynthesis protein TsaB